MVFSSWRRFCAFEGWKTHLFSDFSARPTLKGWNRCRMLQVLSCCIYFFDFQIWSRILTDGSQHIPRTLLHNTSTTPLRHNTPSQHSFSTTAYYEVLQSNTPTVRPPKRRQNDVHPVLLRTTKITPTSLRTTKRLPSSTTPRYKVLQNTTPIPERSPSSTTPYYKVLQSTTKYLKVLQSFYVLQNDLPVLRRTTKDYRSFQNLNF